MRVCLCACVREKFGRTDILLPGHKLQSFHPIEAPNCFNLERLFLMQCCQLGLILIMIGLKNLY